jgi:hypothetical protein
MFQKKDITEEDDESEMLNISDLKTVDQINKYYNQ